MPEIIIADTSSLIGFDKINHLDLLKVMYGRVTVTEEVAEEYGEPLPEWFEVRTAGNRELMRSFLPILHVGEASAITLAVETKDSILVIDEKDGRKVARQMGLRLTGTLGILLKAKLLGHIPRVQPFILELLHHGFRIDELLVQQVLEQAGE